MLHTLKKKFGNMKAIMPQKENPLNYMSHDQKQSGSDQPLQTAQPSQTQSRYQSRLTSQSNNIQGSLLQALSKDANSRQTEPQTRGIKMTMSNGSGRRDGDGSITRVRGATNASTAGKLQHSVLSNTEKLQQINNNFT